MTELRAGGAKSVFHFDVQGSVAKSSHAGIPWLRFLRHRLSAKVHFWAFDGWEVPASRSAVAEAYPALWSRSFALGERTADQHDAFSIAAWLAAADRSGSLSGFLQPGLREAEKAVARVEGWILGVAGELDLLDHREASHAVHLQSQHRERMRFGSWRRDAQFGAYAPLPKRACLRATRRVPAALPTPCTRHESAPRAGRLDRVAAAQAVRALVSGVEGIGDAAASCSRFFWGQRRRWLSGLA